MSPDEIHCTAKIWPTWANKWITCGSRVQNGKCVKYGHEVKS